MKIDENIDYLFRRYSEEIVELQKNSLLDLKKGIYLNSFENVINDYNKKAEMYKLEINKVTERNKKYFLDEGLSEQVAHNRSYFLPNIYLKELEGYQISIVDERNSELKNLDKSDISVNGVRNYKEDISEIKKLELINSIKNNKEKVEELEKILAEKKVIKE